jgi:MoxR-like ATPase
MATDREAIRSAFLLRDGRLPQELEPHTSLDAAQQSALVAALTQEICLIQGPPGTGTLVASS